MAFTLRHAMSSLLLLWLCACSTSPYKDQVTAFDKALTKAQTGFVGLANQQATVAAVRQVNEAAVHDGRVLTVSSCNLTLSSRKEPGNCTLMLSGREPVATKSPAANGLVLMKAFVTYGDGLAKLVAAKDISDLNSGISKVNSSIGGLVKTRGGTASFIPYVGPALELAALGFDQYLEARRVEALRTAIVNAQGAVQLAVPILAKEARLLQVDVFQTRNTQLQKRVDEVVDAGSTWTGATLALTEESIQGYAALRTLAEIDAGAVFEQLGAAHRKMVEAALNPQFSLQDATSTILAFAQKAESLYAAGQMKAAPSTKTAKSSKKTGTGKT